MSDITRRTAGVRSAPSHPSFPLSLVDECVRVLQEQNRLAHPLVPTVQIPGTLPGGVPPKVLVKLLSTASSEQLRRFDCLNPTLNTQPVWKGRCRKDFPADFRDTECDNWKEQYDLLLATTTERERRTKHTLREGMAFVRQRAEVRRMQPADAAKVPIPHCDTTLPFLQRRADPPRLQRLTPPPLPPSPSPSSMSVSAPPGAKPTRPSAGPHRSDPGHPARWRASQGSR